MYNYNYLTTALFYFPFDKSISHAIFKGYLRWRCMLAIFLFIIMQLSLKNLKQNIIVNYQMILVV